MEKNFANDNFEDFLRQNADSLRMRPSEKVWEGVSKNLNGRRRRFGWGLGVFLVATCSLLGYFSLNSNGKKALAISAHKNVLSNHQATDYPKPTLAWKNNALIEKEKGATSGERQSNLAANQTGYVNQEPELQENTPIANEETAKDVFAFVPVDDNAPHHSNHTATTASNMQTLTKPAEPLSIESVVNLYKPGKVKKRISTQWYFTPTVSYRKLSENKSYLRSLQGPNTGIAAPSYLDVNSMVTHKPGMGLEVGFALRYPLSHALKLRGGVQFNITRYEVKVFNSVLENATIMLNTGTASTTSINRFSSLNTASGSGFSSDWLQNFYLQVSTPIGVEYSFAGNEKVQFGVATTIQPTYVLDDRAYLISTDYKKYTEVPELSRRWNVNTSLETYVAYSTGKLSWQVGPQVRYQLLSSFVNKYPVKENLFDYGLKVGISLNKNNH